MPITIKFDNTTQCPQQAQIIPNATPFNDGVMTKEQAARLQNITLTPGPTGPTGPAGPSGPAGSEGCSLFNQCFSGLPFTSDANPGVIFTFTPLVPTDHEGQFEFEYIVQSFAPEDAALLTRRKVATYNFSPGSGIFFVQEKEIYNVGTFGAGTVPDSNTPDNIVININGAAGGGDPARVLIWEVQVVGRFSPKI